MGLKARDRILKDFKSKEETLLKRAKAIDSKCRNIIFGSNTLGVPYLIKYDKKNQVFVEISYNYKEKNKPIKYITIKLK